MADALQSPPLPGKTTRLRRARGGGAEEGSASATRYHPFLPAGLQRGPALAWLKRIHAWTGLWGAALFLLLGTSGFLLNHRNLLKIDTGAPQEVSSLDVPVPALADADALGAWAKATLGLRIDGKAPPPEPAGPKAMLGRTLPEAERWTRVFSQPDAKVTVSYLPGAPAATVKTESVGALATIKNLHKGTGLGIGWVLLLDTIAGALIAMSLTGILLWSRLHGPRLLALALAGGCIAAALATAMPFF